MQSPNHPMINDPNHANHPTDHPPVTTNDVQIKPFESGHTRALFVMVFLAAGILLDVVSIVSKFLLIDLLSDAANGRNITTEAAELNDSREALIALVKFLSYIVTGIGFLVWFHRAHRNLPALGAKNLEFTPGWAVGGFFVPFLNLSRPYKVATEIWKGSSPEVGVADGVSWEYAASSPLLGFWWGTWIIANILGNVATLFSDGVTGLDNLIALTWLSVAADVVSIIAAALALLVVKLIDARQEEKYRLLTAAAIQQWGPPSQGWSPPPP